MQFLIDNKEKGVHWEVFENIPQCPNIITIGSSNYASGIRALPQEVHQNTFEIHCIKRGHQLFVVDDVVVPLKAGEFLIVQPNQVHGPAHGIIMPSEIYWFRLPTKLLEGFSSAESSLVISHLREIAGRPCAELLPFICNALDNIISLLEKDSQALASRMTLKNHTISLISALLNLLPQHELNPKRALVVERIGKTIDAMNAVPDKRFNIPELARKCGIGETLYRRMFKEITGFPPVDYIHFTRMEKAIQLLEKGTSVTETAYELGYSSSQHFSRTFSKWTGDAPSSYKRQADRKEKVVTRSSDRLIYQNFLKKYSAA